jgi:hypothetical protein
MQKPSIFISKTILVGFDILQGKTLISNIVENSKMQLFEMEEKSITSLSEMTKIESIILLELTSKESKKKKTFTFCILLNDNFLNLSTTKKRLKSDFSAFFIFKMIGRKNYPYYATSSHSYSAQKNSPSLPHN